MRIILITATLLFISLNSISKNNKEPVNRILFIFDASQSMLGKWQSGRKIDNLILTIDYNKKQIDGSIDEVLPMGSLSAKLKAFDWIVLEEFNGNNIDAVINILNTAKNLTKKGRPIVIILHTEMGHGVDYMMGTHKWHGVAPNDEQLANALLQNPETLGDY